MASPFVPKVRYAGRPALRLLIGCFIGIFLNVIDLLVWGSIALLILALLGFVLSKHSPRLEVFSWIVVWAVLFGWYSRFRTLPIDNMPPGKTLVETEIKVLYPVSSSANSDIQFRCKVRDLDGRWLSIRLQIPRDEMIPEAYHFGSNAIATLDLAALSTIRSASFVNYLLSEGIEAQGYLHSIKELEKDKHPPFRSRMQWVRRQITKAFEQAVGDRIPSDERGVLYALVLGDRSQLSRDIKNSFASTGVAHILAVSGYHLGVVFWVTNFFLGLLFWRYEQRYWRYSFLIIFLITYAFLSGASTATLRALLMSIIIIGSKLLERPKDPIQVLSLTLLIFLMINPLSYLSVGLLLSLSAVWGIYVFLPLFHRIFRPDSWVLKKIIELISVSVAAQIGVLPFLLFYFEQATLSFIWSNIPLILISDVLIPVALLSMGLAVVFGVLPGLLIMLIATLTRWMIGITTFFDTHLEGLSFSLRFDFVLILFYFAIAHSVYLLLHSYVNRLERRRLIEKNSQP